MKLILSPNSIEDYRKFIAIKELPTSRIRGCIAEFPDEYAALIGCEQSTQAVSEYKPESWLFDYQRDIARIAIEQRKFCVFADCGLGKTAIMLEYARTALEDCRHRLKNVLIVSPLMVVRQTLQEVHDFYGDSIPIKQVSAKELPSWLSEPRREIGITNYEALRADVGQGELGALILDESSMLKSHYGHWGTKCIELGRGLRWKLALTGTPAPNDRIEYANHAVFMDAFPTVNAFLAKFFINRGQTSERWELKPHALRPFYTALSHWSIFLTNPAVYGWKDNCQSIPPIVTHIHDVEMTQEQVAVYRKMTGNLVPTKAGGIKTRGKQGQIAKGHVDGEYIPSNRPGFIKRLVESLNGRSTIIWCIYDAEQELIAKQFPDAASISGETKLAKRLDMIDKFKAGETRILISKPKILGFGLNLQICTDQVFSGLQDSYEMYYQAVKRSNRYGSTDPLHVHIPVTDLEAPMVDNVLRKADMVQQDAAEQEKLFRTQAPRFFGKA